MRSRAIFATAVVMVASPGITSAASLCPPEVKEARALLTAKTAPATKATQPSKFQAAARGQDEQAPRGTTAKAARGHELLKYVP